jgi:hypothetical protein
LGERDFLVFFLPYFSFLDFLPPVAGFAGVPLVIVENAAFPVSVLYIDYF